MPPPEKKSVEQKLFRHSRNVLAVILLTYIPFAMIAYAVDILVSFIWQLYVYETTTALENMLSNFDRFLLGWGLIKLGLGHLEIVVPIAWGLCCFYHRRLVFDLPRKTFWYFIPTLLFFWIYNPLSWQILSFSSGDRVLDIFYIFQSIVSILTVLGCWWLVERRRAKILPES